MTALKGGDIDRFLARPDPKMPLVLVYGPDAGSVAERARLLAERSVPDPADPFALVKLDGDEIAGDPLRLTDEANTVGLFGGRRAIRVQAGSRPLQAALEPLFQTPPLDSVVIVEAGDLPPRSPLRAAFERSPAAVALPCYLANDKDLARLIVDEVRAARLTIAPDARTALIALLGADRIASRSEIAKLVTYAAGEARITLDHVEAVVSDASHAAFDPLIDAAFSGRPAAVAERLPPLLREGNRPDAILHAALRQALALARLAAEVAGGKSPAALVADPSKRVFGPRREIVQRQLETWTATALLSEIAALGEAMASARREAGLAEAAAERCLLGIAGRARRGRSRSVS